MAREIHWFPGHMKKALIEIEERIKLVDVVIEILDARAPFSSINEDLEKVITNKKRIAILSKTDLADPEKVSRAAMILKGRFDDLLVLDLTKPEAGKRISNSVSRLGEAKHQKEKAKGMKPQPIKTMILGIPNVGKSSLINRFSARKAAGVENKPGFTRGEQWIKVNNDFILLDTPGILPMNYEDKKKARNLALIGAIREEILPNSDLCEALLTFLKKEYPDSLKSRFDISEISSPEEVIKAIAERRKLVSSNGEPALDKAEQLLLKEFKDGKLGRISLE